jgi:hypothetical protein
LRHAPRPCFPPQCRATAHRPSSSSRRCPAVVFPLQPQPHCRLLICVLVATTLHSFRANRDVRERSRPRLRPLQLRSATLQRSRPFSMPTESLSCSRVAVKIGPQDKG